jgi:hypothetical protein
MTVADATSIRGSNLTVSCWATADSSGGSGTFLAKGSAYSFVEAGGNGQLTTQVQIPGVGTLDSGVKRFGPGYDHFVLVFAGGSPGSAKLYANGVLKATLAMTGSPGTGSGLFVLGGSISINLDEVRVATTARSADWIATEYNNQNSPSTFYSVSSEISFGPQTIYWPGIPSAQSFGTLTLTPGNTTISISSIVSGEAFGLATTAPKIFLDLLGVPTAEAFGSPRMDRSLPFTGIESSEAVGMPVLTGAVVLDLTGIESAEAFGAVELSTKVSLTPESIPSEEAFGSPTLTGGPTSIMWPSIASEEAFGALAWSTDSNQTIFVPSISTGERFGFPTLTGGPTSITWESILSAEAFGVLTPDSRTILHWTGIPSAEAFGRLTLSQLQQVPRLIWSNPAPIDLGTPLGPAQLDARCPDTTGSFMYNPPAGTVLPQGLQRIAVAFTPTGPNAGHWTTASAEVWIQVGEAVTAPVRSFPVNLKYRRQDSNGDYVLTGTSGDYHYNTPAAVAACARSRLLLFAGEYFVDTDAGMPWTTQVLGAGRRAYDTIIRQMILGTPGCTAILEYSSTVDPAQRSLSIAATIDTLYSGQASLSVPLAPGTAPRVLADAPPATPPPPVFPLRVRKMDPMTGDYVLTGHRQDYLVNSAAAVTQIVMTRLRMWTNEYFLNSTEGTPWMDSVLGKDQRLYDAVIKARILDSPGVSAISSYSSSLASGTRTVAVKADLDTIYGQATISTTL